MAPYIFHDLTAEIAVLQSHLTTEHDLEVAELRAFVDILLKENKALGGGVTSGNGHQEECHLEGRGSTLWQRKTIENQVVTHKGRRSTFWNRGGPAAPGFAGSMEPSLVRRSLAYTPHETLQANLPELSSDGFRMGPGKTWGPNLAEKAGPVAPVAENTENTELDVDSFMKDPDIDLLGGGMILEERLDLQETFRDDSDKVRSSLLSEKKTSIKEEPELLAITSPEDGEEEDAFSFRDSVFIPIRRDRRSLATTASMNLGGIVSDKSLAPLGGMQPPTARVYQQTQIAVLRAGETNKETNSEDLSQWETMSDPGGDSRQAAMHKKGRAAVRVRNSMQQDDARRRNFAYEVSFDDDDKDKKAEEGGAEKGRLQRLVVSFRFEMFFAVCIITNSIFMGIQASWTVSNPTSKDPAVFYMVSVTYAVLFLVELCLRMSADGCHFFCSSQWHWNYLDIFIVTSSMLEVVFDLIYIITDNDSESFMNMSNVRIIRIIRITRLIRVFRVARIVRFIRALRTLVYSILCTLGSVVWAMLLLLMIIYVFGIVFAQAVCDHRVDRSYDYYMDKELEMYWGSLLDSMFTLYKSVSGGVSWHDVVLPLSTVSQVWVLLFFFYITFTFFAVLNVVTGVFCQSAIEGAQHDQDMVVQQQLQNRNMYVRKLKKLFKDIDADSSQYITYTEFEHHLKDEKVQAYFASLELDTSDAWELFKLLDQNETHVIDVEEFVLGCLRLKGNARAIDIAKMTYENRTTRKKLTQIMESIESLLADTLDDERLGRTSTGSTKVMSRLPSFNRSVSEQGMVGALSVGPQGVAKHHLSHFRNSLQEMDEGAG